MRLRRFAVSEDWHWNVYGKRFDDAEVVLLYSLPEGNDPVGAEGSARYIAKEEIAKGTTGVRVERVKYSK
jgi:hypothetical protein